MIKINRSNIIQLVSSLRKDNKKIVFTNGCFDILHTGHISLLKKAKKLGDVLIVGLNSDRSVSEIKGPTRPINNQVDRAIMLESLKDVDYVVSFDEKSPENLIKIIKPDVYAKGGDYTKEQLHSTKFIEGYGGQVIIVPFVEGKSTTKIIEKIGDQK